MADPLAPLAAALRDLAAWMDDAKLPCAIIGGVAASMRGRPRATRGVDCLVLADEDAWEMLVTSAAAHDIRPRVADPVAFARESRVLLLRHEPTTVDIDVTLGALLFEEELVARATRVDVAGVSAPVATAEDLVVMKAIAGRARDRSDIEGLLDAHPDLDVGRVRKQVAEFAALLESPEISADLQGRCAMELGRHSIVEWAPRTSLRAAALRPREGRDPPRPEAGAAELRRWLTSAAPTRVPSSHVAAAPSLGCAARER